MVAQLPGRLGQLLKEQQSKHSLAWIVHTIGSTQYIFFEITSAVKNRRIFSAAPD